MNNIVCGGYLGLSHTQQGPKEQYSARGVLDPALPARASARGAQEISMQQTGHPRERREEQGITAERGENGEGTRENGGDP